MDEYYKMFDDYSCLFDMSVSAIKRKYDHSYRVMNIAASIAKSINADVNKAMACALFHDIGRFIQWKNYNTYEDSKSIDHGDVGAEILEENFNMKDKDLIIFSTRNHNKLKIEDTENPEYLLYTRIVRDADKLDIMNTQAKENNGSIFNELVFQNIIDNKLVQNELVITDADIILRTLGFIYDLNFKYSFKYVLDNKIIEEKIDLLKSSIDDSRIDNLYNHLIEYCKGE